MGPFDTALKELQIDLGNLEQMLGKRFDEVMDLLVANDRGNGRYISQITHNALIGKFMATADEKVNLIVQLFELEMSVPPTKE